MTGTESRVELHPDWTGHILRVLTTFEAGNRDMYSGLRVGLLISLPMILGIITGNIYPGLLGSLGVFAVSMPEIPRTRKMPQIRSLFFTGVLNSLAFTLGTLVGMTGFLSVPLFGIGFFFAAFITSNNDTAGAGLIASVLFSLGIGLPGSHSAIAILDRLWIPFAGALLGIAGLLLHSALERLHEKHEEKEGESPQGGEEKTYYQLLKEKVSRNPVLVNEHLLYSIAFGAAGAAALGISHAVDLSRDYWVLLTLAILLLRSDISSAISFTVSRIIGTVIGALLGLLAIAAFTSPAMLVPFLFIFSGLYFALRGLNYALGTIFITPFILVLIDIPNPGHAILALERILDTLIASGITIATVIILWAGGKWKKRSDRLADA